MNKRFHNVIMNDEAYSTLKRSAETLSKKLSKKLSFSDVINMTIGRNFEFLDIPNELKSFINDFVSALKEKEYVLGTLLFGSVSKGTFNENSDIDLLIVVNDGYKNASEISKIKIDMVDEAVELNDRGLPCTLSPFILDIRELGNFHPLYLDFLDYGVILYDRNGTLSRFLENMEKVKHKRSFSEFGEELSWEKAKAR